MGGGKGNFFFCVCHVRLLYRIADPGTEEKGKRNGKENLSFCGKANEALPKGLFSKNTTYDFFFNKQKRTKEKKKLGVAENQLFCLYDRSLQKVYILVVGVVKINFGEMSLPKKQRFFLRGNISVNIPSPMGLARERQCGHIRCGYVLALCPL